MPSRRGDNAAARRLTAPQVIPAALFLGGWLILLLPDSLASGMIPGASSLRMAAPALLSVYLLWEIANNRFRAGALSGWIVAFGVVGILSTVFATVPVLSLIKLCLYLAMLTPLCLSRGLLSTFDGNAKTTWWLVAIAVAMIFATAATMPITGTGFFDNPNKAGMLVVFLWPWAGFLSVCGRGGWKWIGRIACVAALGVCVLAWSRGALISILTAYITYLALRRNPRFINVLVGFLIAGILGAVGYMFANELFVDYAMKNRQTFVDGTRMFMLEETLHYWQYRPLLGYGFGLSWTLHPDDAEAVLETGRMSWFTVEFGNSLLAILSGGGLALLAIFIGLFTTVAHRGFRALQAVRTQSPRRELLTLLMAAMAGMLVHAQAEAWLMSALNWSTALCFLYLGLIVHLSDSLRNTRSRTI